jgi:hypothetical protein
MSLSSRRGHYKDKKNSLILIFLAEKSADSLKVLRGAAKTTLCFDRCLDVGTERRMFAKMTEL